MLSHNKDEINTFEIEIKPEKVIQKGKNNILTLKKLLNQKSNPIIIKGKRYIEYGEWITLGNFYGLSVRTHDVEPVELRGVKGFKAKADLIRISDEAVVGGAEAYCLDNERNQKNKEDFQLASMAQTRSESKALSSALRWVVELEKTLAETAAEEMIGFRNNNNNNKYNKDKNSIKTIKKIKRPIKRIKNNNTSKKREMINEIGPLEITNKITNIKNELVKEDKFRSTENIKAKIIQ